MTPLRSQTRPRPADLEQGAATPPGPAQAGEAWYHAHGTEIYRYLRYHAASADVAEDLTAETFLRAVRAAERFDPARGTARAWLFRIAQNVLRDHRRQLRRRPWVPVGALRDLASEAPSPEERLLLEEEVAGLLEALATLGERDRTVLSLRYGSGLDHATIAEILGMRETAVRTRVWRALARLREALEP